MNKHTPLFIFLIICGFFMYFAGFFLVPFIICIMIHYYYLKIEKLLENRQTDDAAEQTEETIQHDNSAECILETLDGSELSSVNKQEEFSDTRQ